VRNKKSARIIITRILCACSLVATPALFAQSQTASDLSLAPVALSVVAPASVLASGVILTIKSVQVSANGTVILLESIADASKVTVEVSGDLSTKASAFVGKSAAVSLIASGTVITAAGEVLAFIPNEIGRELMYNEKLTP
jgi:hypothetical protein